MAEITDVITAVQSVIGQDTTLAALARPLNPPDNLNLPAVVVYAPSGGMRPRNLDGDWEGAHTVRVEVHVAREAPSLDAAHASLMGYLPRVKRQLLNGYTDNRFGETCVLAGGPARSGDVYPLRYAVEQDEWNAVKTLALAVEFDVLIEESL